MRQQLNKLKTYFNKTLYYYLKRFDLLYFVLYFLSLEPKERKLQQEKIHGNQGILSQVAAYKFVYSAKKYYFVYSNNV
jgi:hypothetical protein